MYNTSCYGTVKDSSGYLSAYMPFSQYNIDAKPAIHSTVSKTTRDQPRKFRDKRTITTFNGHSLRRWSYLPFWTTKAETTYSGGTIINGNRVLPECAIDNLERKVYWATRSPNTQYWGSPFRPSEQACENLRFYFADGLSLSVSDPFLDWVQTIDLTPLVNKALTNMESALSNLPDMLVVLAELRELPELFSAPKDLSGAYLQNQFGVQPTIGAVRDTLVGVSHRWNDLAEIRTVKATYKLPSVVDANNWVLPSRMNDCFKDSTNPCIRHGYRSLETRTEAEAKLEIVYSINPPPELAGFMKAFDKWLERVNALGDLSTLWELIPFSWMVDWFLPVGTHAKVNSVKAGIGKWYGLTVHDAFVSVRRRKSSTYICDMLPCFHNKATTTCSLEDYARFPFYNPWDFLKLAEWGVRIPTRLSQALTFAALAH